MHNSRYSYKWNQIKIEVLYEFSGGKMKETPLHIGARVKDGDRCALMLLKSGAAPNLTTDDGETPVHVAAKHGNLQTLQLLLDDGGDPLFTNKVRNYSNKQFSKF